MFNKILIWFSFLLSCILVVENRVYRWNAIVFITHTDAGNLTLISVIIWIVLGYWIRWFIHEKNNTNDEYDNEF